MQDLNILLLRHCVATAGFRRRRTCAGIPKSAEPTHQPLETDLGVPFSGVPPTLSRSPMGQRAPPCASSWPMPPPPIRGGRLMRPRYLSARACSSVHRQCRSCGADSSALSAGAVQLHVSTARRRPQLSLSTWRSASQHPRLRRQPVRRSSARSSCWSQPGLSRPPGAP